ncbi:hypothetical protein BDZ97DRAFT_1757577 [Flammula alnicola]|nr:hypothetical protein BDZ97DRAFT_1757577 [Flammula alnicola]
MVTGAWVTKVIVTLSYVNKWVFQQIKLTPWAIGKEIRDERYMGRKFPKCFLVCKSYFVPWAEVQVPESLQRQIFPFCEDALAILRVGGCKNQGTINFLELLQSLRPFFWRAISAIQTQFPESGIIKRFKVLSNREAKSFLQQWPGLLEQEELARHQSSLIERTYSPPFLLNFMD